ncbi:MAG: SDR family NAD(P)-dependent oxidoreductase [Terriglobales bacterium]
MLPEGKPLAGKVALITGGGRRIGRAIALAFAASGADVVITFRESGAAAQEVAKLARARGVRCLLWKGDLRRNEAPAELVAAVMGEFGCLDVLVNNAGKYETAEFAHMSDASWDAMLATNLTAPFRLSREALPHLRAARGRIINLSSIGARRAFPTHAHYCAAKAGLDHLTRAMARALAPEVQVNAIAPGLIAFEAELTPWEAKMRERTPLQRTGTGADVAETAVFLAACTPFLTGQVIAVDGGLAMI